MISIKEFIENIFAVLVIIFTIAAIASFVLLPLIACIALLVWIF
jgi:hypothetical protein